MELTVEQVRNAGLAYLLEDAVANNGVKSRQDYGYDNQDQWHEAPEVTPSGAYDHASILAANLSEAVAAGEISERTAASMEVFSDTSRMLGIDPDVATSYAVDAIDTGDFSLIAAQQGIDVEAAKASISAVYEAVTAEAEKALGQIGVLELERAAYVHPEARQAILQVGHAVATGAVGRSAFNDLLSELKQHYRF